MTSKPAALAAALTVFWTGVRVVHSERLFSLNTRVEQHTFSMPCLQHVEINADVGIEEFSLKEG